MPTTKKTLGKTALATRPKPEATAAKPKPEAPATKPAPEPEAETPKPVVVTDGKFDWDGFCSSIEEVNLGISTTLKKCSYAFNNNQLQIITERKIHKTILSSVNNMRLLQKFLPEGVSLEIGNGTELAANNKKLGQISDIMGNVTEVKPDGVPF